MQFDPFRDRLSRDIRNDLSAAMMQMLDQLEMAPVRKAANRYLVKDIEPFYRYYISDRLARYKSALAVISNGSADVFWRALVLWDRKLFFEVHEVLEHVWYRAAGEEKEILQAMIRAAAVYIKLEYGYSSAARRIADRALPVLRKQKAFLARYFDPAALLESLEGLHAEPPRLLG